MVTDAIVCAHAERAETFVPVIRALRKGARGQVVFVDDGANRGVWRARLAGAHVVRGPQSGKGEAMAEGLKHVRTDRVIFADADLRGFTADHARRLARPFSGQICGLRDQGFDWLSPLPPITGERSLPTPVARATRLHDYEAETALNEAIGNRGLPVEHFTMSGVTNPSKQPLTRTVQVARAVVPRIVGLIQYMLSWLTTKAVSLCLS